ncbi:enoyl-CoA hydratase/isomeras-like protein [Paraphoma chrysanthemicola]|nr:enoyl-CoA hydratase/isomeras-like protein [Paraphoma chrysanthemicola]
MMNLFILYYCAFALLLPTITALELPTYPGLRTNTSRPGLLQIAFNNTSSAINVWSQDALSGLTDIVRRLRNDTETKVLLFTSDKPFYFMAHLDLTIQPFDVTIAQRTAELLHNMTNLNQVTIGAVNGVARGAGNEFLVSLDMRFAVKSHTRLGQPEIGLGLIPGGGGSQYLPRLIGRGRAFEYLLTGQDVLAEEAERLGWINKAFDKEGEMEAYVDEIVSRLVLFPVEALGLIKQSVNIASRPQLADTVGDANRFLQTASRPMAQKLIGDFLELTANQSAGDIELYLGDNVRLLYD